MLCCNTALLPATAAVLESLNIPPGTERVLFKTLNTARWGLPVWQEPLAMQGH